MNSYYSDISNSLNGGDYSKIRPVVKEFYNKVICMINNSMNMSNKNINFKE